MESIPPAPSGLTHDDQLQLLEAYAPVLRFSAGERFFPMDVHDYIDHSRLKRRRSLFCPDADVTTEWQDLAAGTRPDQGWRKFFRRTRPKPNAAALAKTLVAFNRTHYLSFRYDKKGEAGVPSLSQTRTPRAFLVVLMFLLVLLPGVGWFSRELRPLWLPLWNYSDLLKAALMVVMVVFWPRIQIDRKAYFAMSLLVVSCLSFGTSLGYGVAFLGLLIGLGFLIMYGLLAGSHWIWERIARQPWYIGAQAYSSYFRVAAELTFLVLAAGLMARLWDGWASTPGRSALSCSFLPRSPC
jgi:hypothetical protein